MLEFRAAAFWIDLVRGLSAITCPWRLHLNFSYQVESIGWFSAFKLIARISGPGHSQPVRSTQDRTPEGQVHSKTCRMAYCGCSAIAAVQLLTKISPQVGANQTFDKPEILGHTHAHLCWGFRIF